MQSLLILNIASNFILYPPVIMIGQLIIWNNNNNNNNNKALFPYSTCKMLHDELECSLALTHIVPIYTIK